MLSLGVEERCPGLTERKLLGWMDEPGSFLCQELGQKG